MTKRVSLSNPIAMPESSRDKQDDDQLEAKEKVLNAAEEDLGRIIAQSRVSASARRTATERLLEAARGRPPSHEHVDLEAPQDSLDSSEGEAKSRHLYLELTERCNLSCRFCYVRRGSKHDAASRELDATTVCQLIDEAAAIGFKHVHLTGGSPELHTGFKRVYNYCAEKRLTIYLATNATLITDDVAATLAEYHPARLAVSLYGYDSTSYETHVGNGGAYDAFVAGLSRLTTHSIPFTLRYPPLPDLVRKRFRLEATAARLGTASPLPYTWDLLQHSRDEPGCRARIKSMRLSPEAAAREKLKAPGAALRDTRMFLAGQRRNAERLFRCGAGIRRAAIDPYGYLHPCLQLKHPRVVCRLQRRSFNESLGQVVFQVRSLTTRHPDYLKYCSNCALRMGCPTCPLVSWLETRELGSRPHYYCEVAHAEARLLGLLREGEKGWEVLSLPS